MKLRLLLATAILAVFAVPALAADHEISLSSAKLVAEWEGAPDFARGSPINNPESREQIPCDTPVARPCEEILLKVEEAGKFTATLTGQPGPGGESLTTDVDAWLYKSDASGAQGEAITSGTASGPDSVTFAKAVAGGYYLLIADYYNAYGGGYKGSVKFTPAVAPAAAAPAPVVTAPAPAPATKPAPAKKKKSKKAACQKKAKKIKSKSKRKKALKKCSKMKR